MTDGDHPAHGTVLVFSAIACRDKPLTYSRSRSRFDASERAAQTARTLESVRQHMPGVTSVLVEMGTDPAAVTTDISKLAHACVYVGSSPLVRFAVDSKRKGLGEAVGLLAASRDFEHAPYYFKLSGRYWLTSFDSERWPQDGFAFRRYGSDVSTRFYGFPQALFREWQTALLASVPGLALGRGIERVLPQHIRSPIVDVSRLGVEGLTAVEGELLVE